MNIGLFTDSYYPEISGLATSIYALRKELVKRGHKVFIFTTSNPLAAKRSPGVFRLPSMPFVFLKSRRVGLLYSPRAAKCVKRLKLDIIHTQTEFSLGIFGKLMARQMGIPVVHTYHTLYKDYFHYISKGKFKRLSDGLVRVLSRNYCNGCESVIAPSWKVYDLLMEYGTQKPVRVIPTGIDLDRFGRENYSENDLQKLRESLGIMGDEPVVVYVGRLAKEKSFDAVIRQMPKLLKKLPEAKLLVVGDGPCRQELVDMAGGLGISSSVIFTGEQPWDQVGKFYRLGDAFVSSSVTETQGLTIIEAMASEVPVVVRDDRNIERLIADRVNGRVFRTDSELVSILFELLSHRETGRKLAENARSTVGEYSMENFGASMEKLYFEVLGVKSRVRRKSTVSQRV